MSEALGDFAVWPVTDEEKDARKQRGHRSVEARCESHSVRLKRSKAQGPAAHDERYDTKQQACTQKKQRYSRSPC